MGGLQYAVLCDRSAYASCYKLCVTGDMAMLDWCPPGVSVSTVNGHYSLIVERELRATTRVDHPGYAASPQIGVQVPLYSDTGRQCGTPAPVGGQYPLKPLGDTSPAWPCHLSRKAYSTKHTQSDHAGWLTVDLPNVV